MKKLALLFLALIACAAPARAQYLGPSFFGMNFSSTPASSPIMAPYTAAKLLGGTWGGVETCRPTNPANQSDGCWYWTALDAGLAMCSGIGVDCDYVLLMNTPTWATATHDTAAPPDNLNDFYNFATTFATRYKGKVKLYEVANEMSYSGWYDGTLAQIVTISNQLCSIIHATDPAAKLYSPSTFYISGEQYFANYLAAGGSTCDGVSLHPYPLFTNTDYNPTAYPEESWNQVQFYSALFKQYGQTNLLISEGGQTWSTYDPAADGAIWLLQMTGFAYNGFATRVMPYSWNIQTRVGLGYTDAKGNPNTRGVAYMNAQAWLEGATVSQPPTRTAGTNGIRNPNGTGFTAGTPGTPPTNWGLSAPDSAFGVSTQIVGPCANNGVSGVAWRVWGTPTTGAALYTKLTLEGTQQIAANLGQWWTRGGTASLIAGSLNNLTVTYGWNEMNSSGATLGNTGSSLNSRITPIAPAVAQAYSVKAKYTGVAYVQPAFTVNYTLGAPIDATFCLTGQTMDTGNVWTMTIARPGGYQGLIVWSANYSGPVPYNVPSQYLFWRDVMGNSGPVKNGKITIGARPVLLETGPATTVGPVASVVAPVGDTPQYPNLLSAYPYKPSWQVAGVDYYVGVPSSVALKDPSTAVIPGVDVDSSIKRFAVDTTAGDVTIDGYDFTQGGGWSILFYNGAHKLTVKNSSFAVGSNHRTPFSTYAGVGDVTITDSTFDGAFDGDTSLNTLVAYTGTGTFTLQRNWFKRANSDAVNVNNAAINLVAEYNLFDNTGAAGAHGDVVQLAGAGPYTLTLRYNTTREDPGLSAQGFMAEPDGGSTTGVITGGEIGYNAFTGALSVFTGVTIADLTGPFSVHDNYFDPTNTLGGLAFGGARGGPGDGNAFTSYLHNVDMTSGAIVSD